MNYAMFWTQDSVVKEELIFLDNSEILPCQHTGWSDSHVLVLMSICSFEMRTTAVNQTGQVELGDQCIFSLQTSHMGSQITITGLLGENGIKTKGLGQIIHDQDPPATGTIWVSPEQC